MADDNAEGQEEPESASTMVEKAGETERQATSTLVVENRFRNGAHWFYWIAGFSLVNTVFALGGSDWGGFLFGLGFTQIVDVFAGKMNSGLGKAIAFIIDLLVIAFYVAFGYLARSRYRWAFLIGMGAYVLDGLLFLLVGYWLGVLFHAFALVGIVRGYTALKQLEEMEHASPA